MIEVQNITLKYKETIALQELSVSINQGEKVSVIGQSGCGKTSFLHALSGIIKPSEGKISIFGKCVEGIRKETSVVLQKDGLFPWKNVESNIMLALIHEVDSKKEKLKKVSELLAELGITEQRYKYINELSGGQRQRVSIARALIRRPDLLLMDEPTGSLDMMTKERFQDSLHELYREHSMTTIIVTHDIEEAVYLGQRILVMDKGKIIEEIVNPFFGDKNMRHSIDFYQLCLKVRQVMKC